MRLSDTSVIEIVIKQSHLSEPPVPLVTAPSFLTDQPILLNVSESWVFSIPQEHSWPASHGREHDW